MTTKFTEEGLKRGAAVLAMAMSHLQGEAPHEVYDEEGYAIWLRSVVHSVAQVVNEDQRDPWEDESAIAWVNHVHEEMAPKMEDSAMVISIVPSDRIGDVKFWVELGAAIMLNKPIIAAVLGDADIPPKLAQIANEVVRCPDGVNPEASEEMSAAIGRVVATLKEKEGDSDE